MLLNKSSDAHASVEAAPDAYVDFVANHPGQMSVLSQIVHGLLKVASY